MGLPPSLVGGLHSRLSDVERGRLLRQISPGQPMKNPQNFCVCVCVCVRWVCVRCEPGASGRVVKVAGGEEGLEPDSFAAERRKE